MPISYHDLDIFLASRPVSSTTVMKKKGYQVSLAYSTFCKLSDSTVPIV